MASNHRWQPLVCSQFIDVLHQIHFQLDPFIGNPCSSNGAKTVHPRVYKEEICIENGQKVRRHEVKHLKQSGPTIQEELREKAFVASHVLLGRYLRVCWYKLNTGFQRGKHSDPDGRWCRRRKRQRSNLRLDRGIFWMAFDMHWHVKPQKPPIAAAVNPIFGLL